MATKYLNTFLILVFSALLLHGCSSVSSVAKKIAVKSGEIPPEMPNEYFTIIAIVVGKKNYDKYVLKAFENYTGKYILATQEEVNKTYSDSLVYRYIMHYDFSQDRILTYNSTYRRTYDNAGAAHYYYYILDRQTGKKYVRKMGSSFFALEMQAYVKAIEAARKK
jgi:hypothetical protein